MTTLNQIRIALENHLATTSATPAPALPSIAWPNVVFTPAPGTSYLRAEFIPVLRRPVVAGPSPEQRFSGLFYLTIYTPEEKGAADGMSLADKLLSRFNGSSSIVTVNAVVRIEYSEVKMPLHDPPFYAIPVEVGWYSYATP
jgi:hypothetical protein